MAAKMQLSAEQALKRLKNKEPVDAAEVSELLRSADPRSRQIANLAIARSALREAFFAIAGLVRAQSYGDQASLHFAEQLSPLVDTDIPYIEILKGLGLQAAFNNDFPTAIKFLQEAINKGFRTGQLPDLLSRSAMRFIHDEEIDRALEHLSRLFAPPRFAAPPQRNRVSLLVSALPEESGPSIVTLAYARGLRERGFDVEIVSTEYAVTGDTWFARTLRAEGFPLTLITTTDPREKIVAITRHYEDSPANVVFYMITIMDAIGKILSCLGLAPAQLLQNFNAEPYVGKFEFLIQCVSVEQEAKTLWPGKSRFVGTMVATGDEIDQAQPMPRSEIGIPEDALMFATFGRLEKCTSREYIEAAIRILERVPHGYLVLAGPGAESSWKLLSQAFRKAGVDARVRYLGRRQNDAPSLVRAVDIYCDTYPWPGGQSLYDAMWAGVPVVAMRRLIDPDVDPSGAGSNTALSEVTIGDAAPLAPSGDIAAYVKIACDYAADPALREQVGSRLADRIREYANKERHFDMLVATIRDAIAASH